MEKKQYNYIDFDDNESIVYYGQDLINRYYKCCDSAIENDCEYELVDIYQKLEALIFDGNIMKSLFSKNVEYCYSQLELSPSLPLKIQYFVVKNKLDLFKSRLNYLESIKNKLKSVIKLEEKCILKK